MTDRERHYLQRDEAPIDGDLSHQSDPVSDLERDSEVVSRGLEQDEEQTYAGLLVGHADARITQLAAETSKHAQHMTSDLVVGGIKSATHANLEKIDDEIEPVTQTRDVSRKFGRAKDIYEIKRTRGTRAAVRKQDKYQRKLDRHLKRTAKAKAEKAWGRKDWYQKLSAKKTKRLERKVAKTQRILSAGKWSWLYKLLGALGVVALLLAVVVMILSLLATLAASQKTTSYEGMTDIETTVARYFIDKGLDPLQVAAVMGNIYAESGFDAGAIEVWHPDAGDGMGLCQWSFGRRVHLEEYAASIGKQATDLQVQLDFLWSEMTGEGAASAYSNVQYDHGGLLVQTDLDEAVYYFGRKFERPNESYADWPKRLTAAKKYYQIMTSSNGAGDPVISGNGTLNHPCPAGMLTSGFGSRWGTMHNGTDFGAAEGTPYYAAESGTVISATNDGGWNGGAGNWVRIDHGNGMVTVYMHSSAVYVRVGDYVTKGQNIGAVGNTGDSYGAHLHFEVRLNGTAVDAMGFL